MTAEVGKSPLLLFDIGNVFIFAEHNITHRYLVSQFGIPLEKAQRFYKDDVYRLFSEGKISGSKFAEVQRDILDAPYLTDADIRKAHDIHLIRLIKRSMVVLERLYGVYPLAFITSTNDWQNAKERELVDFGRFSNTIIRSNEEGLTKKDPEIFERTLERLERRDVLFVDDSMSNIEVAKSQGIDSLYVLKNRPNLLVALQERGIIV